jgi:hypothetical protein
VQGRWNVALGKLTAEKVLVETQLSNVHATAEFHGAAAPFMQVKVESAGIQAADVLACYRAFHPGVDDGITADAYFSGTLAAQGWPVELQAMDFSTSGGRVNIRGMDAVSVGPFLFARAGLKRPFRPRRHNCREWRPGEERGRGECGTHPQFPGACG